MRVTKRMVPNDILAFDHKEFHVFVGADRKEIAVRVEKDGDTVHRQDFTPEQFISLLMRDAR